MRLSAIALALSTLSLTSCGDRAPLRAIPVVPDPAVLAECPRRFATLNGLKPLVSVTLAEPATGTDDATGAAVTLPAGTRIVLFQDVLDRDEVTARAFLAAHAAWQGCVSVAVYVEDWTGRVQGGAEARP